MRLSESAVDTSKIWFHGSSEAKVTQLDPPSYEHPFYVTSDLHYAMAFCTKSSSNTGDWGFQKTFTPASQNYVYVVSLKPSCKVFDFRDHSSAEFQHSFGKIIDPDIVEWIIEANPRIDSSSDIYEFCIGLDTTVLSPLSQCSFNYLQYEKFAEDQELAMSKQLFIKACQMCKNLGYADSDRHMKDLEIHEIMVPILRALKKQGFQGIMTTEHDYNIETSEIYAKPAKVTTDSAIGIFDASGLDMLSLVPMKYTWLKKINPSYWYNSTDTTADAKLRQFISLYKQMATKRVNESECQYDPPYTLDQIKANYPEKIYDKLASCPIHRWRAETGIELIHREPTEEELDRIWKNWQLMPQKMKDISDKKSIELFGCTNAEHYAKLKNKWLNEEEGIANNDIYLSGMAKSFADKAWFLKYIPDDITTIVDFGGGTGDFAKFCQAKRPDLRYAIVDNNSEFFDQAKSNGFIAASSLQNLMASKAIDFSKTLLVLSSVIHEVYSYADANAFWRDIKKCGFRAIAIRDMSYDEIAMRSAPINAICWVYENVFMSKTITYKGKPFREITESFEDVWGKICDPQTKQVNGKNLFHFLIKYRYQENWAREVEENYLPISKEKLASTLVSMGYAFAHKQSSKLAFYDKCWKKDFKLGIPDNNGYRKQFYMWLTTLATHIKWMLKKNTIIDKLDENKATYLQKYASEDDVNTVVEMFWHIRNKLSAPQNDIDWWIKKPFAELKKFVQNFDPSNKRQRRDASYKQQAIENYAKLLGTRNGYEIWYVPTYEAMVTLGRFYKGQSAKWCVASDDPEFWFDNYADSEFIVLVREHPQHNEFDKVAIEMEDHGRYYNNDDIMTWDLENNNETFDRGALETAPELVRYAWQLFKDNGETRNMFVG